MKIRILLADDSAFIRAGLRLLLEEEPDIQVVGEAQTGRETVDSAWDLSPDVLIMGSHMPDMNSVDATRLVMSKRPQVKVLALALHGNAQYVSATLRAGALGYLLKGSVTEELLHAVRAIVEGRMYLCRGLSAGY